MTYTTEPGRVVAFSDAVFAIAITLSAVDIRSPEVSEPAGNRELLLAHPAGDR